MPFLYLDPFARIRFSWYASNVNECKTVMVNSMPPFQEVSLNLARYFRQQEKTVIVGGSVATLNPGYYDGTDCYLVAGEFERAAKESVVWFTPDSPLWSVVEKHVNHYHAISGWGKEVIHTFDRGCPVSVCRFCAIKRFPFRKAPDEVFYHVCSALSGKINLIHLGDATTTTDEVERIAKAGIRYRLKFSVSTTVREVLENRDKWAELFKTGVVAFLRTGVEYLEDRKLRQERKPTSKEENVEFLEFTKKHKIVVVAYMLAEEPERELEAIKKLSDKYRHAVFSLNKKEPYKTFGWNSVKGYAVSRGGAAAFPVVKNKSLTPVLNFREVKSKAKVPHFFFLSVVAFRTAEN